MQLTLDLPHDVVTALDRQARALLLSRNIYIRAVLAAVAAQAARSDALRAIPPASGRSS